MTCGFARQLFFESATVGRAGQRVATCEIAQALHFIAAASQLEKQGLALACVVSQQVARIGERAKCVDWRSGANGFSQCGDQL